MTDQVKNRKPSKWTPQKQTSKLSKIQTNYVIYEVLLHPEARTETDARKATLEAARVWHKAKVLGVRKSCHRPTTRGGTCFLGPPMFELLEQVPKTPPEEEVSCGCWRILTEMREPRRSGSDNSWIKESLDITNDRGLFAEPQACPSVLENKSIRGKKGKEKMAVYRPPSISWWKRCAKVSFWLKKSIGRFCSTLL